MEAQGAGPPGHGPDLTGRPARPRVVAVDWSGRRDGASRHIWAAEVAAGHLVSLESGRSRAEVADALAATARQGARLVIGLDFAFSFPEWFLAERGLPSACALWEAAEREGEAWLARCPWPFWGGRACGRRPDLGGRAHFRRTDLATKPTGPFAIRPKSPFQIGGAGSVGTGSIRGMPLLTRLRREGCAIWPFDAAPGGWGWPRVVEIYPRLLTGAVRKSDRLAREAYLDHLGWPADRALRRRVASSEDAFDAAVSARAMDRHWQELVELPPPAPEAPPPGRAGSGPPAPTTLVRLPVARRRRPRAGGPTGPAGSAP